jgi:hypothetical protein
MTTAVRLRNCANLIIAGLLDSVEVLRFRIRTLQKYKRHILDSNGRFRSPSEGLRNVLKSRLYNVQ